LVLQKVRNPAAAVRGTMKVEELPWVAPRTCAPRDVLMRQ